MHLYSSASCSSSSTSRSLLALRSAASGINKRSSLVSSGCLNRRTKKQKRTHLLQLLSEVILLPQPLSVQRHQPVEQCSLAHGKFVVRLEHRVSLLCEERAQLFGESHQRLLAGAEYRKERESTGLRQRENLCLGLAGERWYEQKLDFSLLCARVRISGSIDCEPSKK